MKNALKVKDIKSEVENEHFGYLVILQNQRKCAFFLSFFVYVPF